MCPCAAATSLSQDVAENSNRTQEEREDPLGCPPQLQEMPGGMHAQCLSKPERKVTTTAGLAGMEATTLQACPAKKLHELQVGQGQHCLQTLRPEPPYPHLKDKIGLKERSKDPKGYGEGQQKQEAASMRKTMLPSERSKRPYQC